MGNSPAKIRQIGADDCSQMRKLLAVFAEAFEQDEMYAHNQPGPAYLEDLLGSPTFIAVIAERDDTVVGGLTAYELKKFEQERSEIYIYDLAVAEQHRRCGIATALIARLKEVARTRGAYVIYVQADLTDDAAIALYTKLGKREDVLHFDIDVA